MNKCLSKIGKSSISIIGNIGGNPIGLVSVALDIKDTFEVCFNKTSRKRFILIPKNKNDAGNKSLLVQRPFMKLNKCPRRQFTQEEEINLLN